MGDCQGEEGYGILSLYPHVTGTSTEERHSAAAQTTPARATIPRSWFSQEVGLRVIVSLRLLSGHLKNAFSPLYKRGEAF